MDSSFDAEAKTDWDFDVAFIARSNSVALYTIAPMAVIPAPAIQVIGFIRAVFKAVPIATRPPSELFKPSKAVSRFETTPADAEADSATVSKDLAYLGISFKALSAISRGTFPTFKSLLISMKSLACSSSDFKALYCLPDTEVIPLKACTRFP